MNIDEIKHLKKHRVKDLFSLLLFSVMLSLAITSFGLSGLSLAHFGGWLLWVCIPLGILFGLHSFLIAIHIKRRFNKSVS